MPEPRAKFLITAEDRASRVIRNVRGQFDGLSRVAASLARIGGIGGIAGFTLSLGAAVKEAETAERQIFKLEQLIKSTGYAAGLTAEDLDDFSRSLARSTLASTEGVRDAAGVLLTFKSISGDTFKETLSLAQDLAATIGTDLKSNVLQLGKALEDPTRGLSALTRSGVSFTESEKELIKTLQESGRQLEAQEEILAKVREQVGGAGVSESAGLSGSVDSLTQSWSEFLEEIGKSGPIDAAKSFIDGLTERIDTLNRALFTPDRDKFYELADRRAQLLRSLDNPRSGQSRRQTAAIRREIQEVEAQMRELQDKNIARIKKQGEAQAKAQLFQQKRAAEAAATVKTESSSRRSGLSEAEKEAQEFASRLQALQDQLDPTIAATRDYLENVALLDRAWSEGQISGERYQLLLATLATDTDALKASEERLASERERALQLIKSIDPVSGVRDQLLEVQRLRDTLPDLSESLFDVEFDLQGKLEDFGDAAVDAAEKTKDAWQSLGPTFASAAEDAIVNFTSLRDVMRGFEDDLVRIGTRKLVTEPVGEFFGSFFSGKGAGGSFLNNLFGFATGGSFMVGGNGGTDSQLVAFRASPNERVTVETPGQQQQRGIQIGKYDVHIHTQDYDTFRKNRRMIARDLRTDLLGAF